MCEILNVHVVELVYEPSLIWVLLPAVTGIVRTSRTQSPASAEVSLVSRDKASKQVWMT